MKKEDLMIGDWIEVTNSDHLKYVQVDAIFNDLILTKEAEYESEEIDINDLKPIRVTKDLLEQIGFEHDNDEDLMIGVVEVETSETPIFLISKDHRITINNVDLNSFNKWYAHIDSEDMRTIFSGEFTFLHELQHIYRLGKIEEDIIIKRE